MKYRVYSATNVGKVRDKNDDYCLYGDTSSFSYFIVADGLGGYSGGNIASKLACEITKSFFENKKDSVLSPTVLTELVDKITAGIETFIKKKPEFSAMATTFTMLVFTSKKAYLLHIGDSRLYSLTYQLFKQISTDQTMVQKLLDEGFISYEEYENHPKKHVLINCLGATPTTSSIILKLKLEPGYYLLCSDGLYNEVSNEDLAATLSNKTLSIEEKGEILMTKALNHGGKDNITFILLELYEPTN